MTDSAAHSSKKSVGKRKRAESEFQFTFFDLCNMLDLQLNV